MIYIMSFQLFSFEANASIKFLCDLKFKSILSSDSSLFSKVIIVVVAGVTSLLTTSISLLAVFSKGGFSNQSPGKSFDNSSDKSFDNSSDKSFGGPYKNRAVAKDTPQCSEIGKDILNANGSAVDAAITAMFCPGVVSMHSSGIGGGGVMLVYIQASRKATVIDFRETAPATADKDMFKGNKNKSKTGQLYLSVDCGAFQIRCCFSSTKIALIAHLILLNSSM